MKIARAMYSHIGIMPENEDAMCCEILPGGRAYAVVADGLGGHGGGGEAARIALRQLSACKTCGSLPTEDQIRRWMLAADQEILSSREDAYQMKTTAVVLFVYGKQAVWAHIGDSRLYHFYNGELEEHTEDHSVPQIQVLSGELRREQIPQSPERSKILRALGTGDAEPEIHVPILLREGFHAFLLCTDGFWEYLQEEEMRLDLMKSSSPEDWLCYLRCRGETRKTGRADNNTAVALMLVI